MTDKLPLPPTYFQKLIAETFGTFALVFIGTGAATVNELTGDVTHAGVALAFGLVVTAMIYCIGDLSGAHMNPAVTIGFAVAGRFRWKEVPGYALVQCLGAVLGSGLLWLLFPKSEFLGATLPAGTQTQSLILEIVLTFILMVVILAVSTGPKEKGITAGVAVGTVIAFEAMMGGPICGASMNPARSLSPAVWIGDLSVLWLYIAGPILGAVAAVPLCKIMLVRHAESN